MRRKDREVTDPIKIEDIIRRCTCLRIGFYDDGDIYIVPLNFGYEIKNDTYVFYFHGASKGRKADLIQKCPGVGFEMETNYAVYSHSENDVACDCTARFQSIIGNGFVKTVTEYEEKIRGLKLLMEHNTGKQEWIFDEKMMGAVTVFKLEVTKMSCKEHK